MAQPDMHLTDDEKRLLKAAWEAARNAYAPYSGVSKGAAVLTEDGDIFAGTSVELVSWAGSICAEEAAIANCILHGQRQLKTIAVVPLRQPCGACLQRICEFSAQAKIISESDHGQVAVHNLAELLPVSFNAESYKSKEK